MKQTAIEWFTNQLEKHYVFQDIKNTTAFLHAKEMEKEQIVNANRDGVDMVVDKKDFISGEQYYYRTFNTNENV